MKVISLGWGVRSFALAAMSALGILPSVDAAVHADTGHERAETYAFAAKWTPWLEERGVQVVTVKTKKNQVIQPGTNSIMIPARSEKGLLRRQCTGDWKIDPVRRWCAAELKRRGLKKTSGVDFRSQEEHGQLTLWEAEECSGMCFL